MDLYGVWRIFDYGGQILYFIKLILFLWVCQYLEAFIRRCYLKKVLLKILQNSQENSESSLKMRPQHKCFLVNFAKFLRTAFFIEHLRWLLLNLSSCFYIFAEETVLSQLLSPFFSERFFPVSLIWRWYVFDRHKKYLQYEWSRKVECCPQLLIYKVLMHTLIVWHNNDHNDRILNTFAIFNEKFYWKLIQVEWCERVSCFHVVSLTSSLNSL